MTDWWQHPVCVPFGNPNYDSALGGAHDMDVQCPPNTHITALLPGKISSITSPDWGMSVGLQFDHPYNNVPFMSFLHLAAVNPALKVGSHVNTGDTIGWSGGCNTQGQYAGTSNPTGKNFTNSTFSSSQPQCGIALMRGPEYGTGAGWSTFPPVDWSLNPTQLVTQHRVGGWSNTAQQAQAATIWSLGHKVVPVLFPGQVVIDGSGIYGAWCTEFQAGRNHGHAVTPEIASVNWSNKRIIVQFFADGYRCEWDGQAHWYFAV